MSDAFDTAINEHAALSGPSVFDTARQEVGSATPAPPQPAKKVLGAPIQAAETSLLNNAARNVSQNWEDSKNLAIAVKQDPAKLIPILKSLADPRAWWAPYQQWLDIYKAGNLREEMYQRPVDFALDMSFPVQIAVNLALAAGGTFLAPETGGASETVPAAGITFTAATRAASSLRNILAVASKSKALRMANLATNAVQVAGNPQNAIGLATGYGAGKALGAGARFVKEGMEGAGYKGPQPAPEGGPPVTPPVTPGQPAGEPTPGTLAYTEWLQARASASGRLATSAKDIRFGAEPGEFSPDAVVPPELKPVEGGQEGAHPAGGGASRNPADVPIQDDPRFKDIGRVVPAYPGPEGVTVGEELAIDHEGITYNGKVTDATPGQEKVQLTNREMLANGMTQEELDGVPISNGVVNYRAISSSAQLAAVNDHVAQHMEDFLNARGQTPEAREFLTARVAADFYGMVGKTVEDLQKQVAANPAFTRGQMAAAKLRLQYEHAVTLDLADQVMKEGGANASDETAQAFLAQLEKSIAVQKVYYIAGSESSAALRARMASQEGPVALTEAGHVIASAAEEHPAAVTDIRILQEQLKGVPNVSERAAGLAKAVRQFKTGEAMAAFQKAAPENAWRLTGRAIAELFPMAWLTGPVTHIMNMSINTATSLYEGAVKEAAAGFGAARERVVSLSGGTPAERLKFGDAHRFVTGTLDAYADMFRVTQFFGEGGEGNLVRQAGRSFLTQQSPYHGTKVGELSALAHLGERMPGPLGKTVRAAGVIASGSGRALLAEDTFAQGVGYRAQLNMDASRVALKQLEKAGNPFTDADVDARAKALLNAPTKEMLTRAKAQAEYQTQTSDPGRLTRALVRLRDSSPVGKLLVPFVLQPTRAGVYAGLNSPAAVFFPEFWREVAKGGAERDTALTRAALGTGALLGVYGAASKGWVTGENPPPDKPKYSIQGPGGTWYRYDRMDQVGMMLHIGASLNEAANGAGVTNKEWDKLDPSGKFVEFLKEGAWGTAHAATNQGFVQPLAEALDAIHRPEANGNYWERLGGSLLNPVSLAGATARAAAPETRIMRGVVDRALANVPGQREKLPMDYDALGKPVTNTDISPFIPVNGRHANQDPVVRELGRHRIVLGTSHMKSISGSLIGVPGGEADLTPAQESEYKLNAGIATHQALARLVQGADFRKIPTDEARRLVFEQVDLARKNAAVGMVRRYPDLLQRIKTSKVYSLTSLPKDQGD